MTKNVDLQFAELFKRANSTLEKQKQAHDMWKIVTNDQSLYEKKVNKLKLKSS